MRRRLSSATAAFLAASVLFASGVAAAQDFDSAGEQEMLVRINAMRAAQQLAPLERSSALDAAARAHCQDMAAHGALTHVSETSGTPADRVRAAGVTAATVAENVAAHRTALDAQQALVASDAHRANMLNPDMTEVGLAALRTDQGVYVTELFAAVPPPQPQVAQAAPAVTAPAMAAPSTPSSPTPSGDDCFSPLPGVRICGTMPAPSVQQVQPDDEVVQAPVAQPDPPQQPQVVQAAPQVQPAQPQVMQMQPQAQGPSGPLVVQPGSNGTVVLQRTPDNTRVSGYWVYGSGRWWYYPMPANAQPGQHLQPDPNVSGPPPGFPAHPGGAPQTAAPQAAAPQVTPGPRAWQVGPGFAVPQQQYARPPAQVTVAPGGAYYSVPPPPMMGNPDRAWRRAHTRWMRAYRRWLRQQAQMRRRAL